jgi:hypothetical protein
MFLSRKNPDRPVRTAGYAVREKELGGRLQCACDAIGVFLHRHGESPTKVRDELDSVRLPLARIFGAALPPRAIVVRPPQTADEAIREDVIGTLENAAEETIDPLAVQAGAAYRPLAETCRLLQLTVPGVGESSQVRRPALGPAIGTRNRFSLTD